MSSLSVTGNSGGTGTYTLQSPNGNNTRTLTLPDVTATLYSDAGTVVTLGTALNTTSGTSIDFTGIPSWARQVTMTFNGVSTNGSNVMLLQLGTSGGVVATGYSGNADSNSGGGTTYTTGLGLDRTGVPTSSMTKSGLATFVLAGSNTWVGTWVGTGITTAMSYGATVIALGGALDRVRLTTVGGTDTFDAGSINVSWM